MTADRTLCVSPEAGLRWFLSLRAFGIVQASTVYLLTGCWTEKLLAAAPLQTSQPGGTTGALQQRENKEVKETPTETTTTPTRSESFTARSNFYRRRWKPFDIV